MMDAIRIMVADDETFLGSLFGEVLEGICVVVCAIETTEASAIATAKHCNPHLLLVDVQLRDGNGVLTVTEILRSGFVPHVFYGADISGLRDSRPGAVALQKAFRVSELARAIECALGIMTRDV